MEHRMSYLFFSQLLPKGKRFDKYIKGEKAEKYPDWLIQIIAERFMVGTAEAVTYLDIYHLTDEGKEELRTLCQESAADPKLIKKAGL
jgi:hypothetical protein